MGFGILPSFKSQRNAMGSIIKSIDNIYEMLNVEYRNHDATHAGTVGTGAAFRDLSGIALGITGGSEDGTIDTGYRNGDSILMKSIYVRGTITANTAATFPIRVRIALIRHYPGFSGDSVATTELYDEATSAIGINQLQNKRWTRRYKILAHREFVLSSYDDHSEAIQRFEFYHKFKRSHIEWEGGSANSPSNGKVYVVIQQDNNTNLSAYDVASRLTYIDN